MRSCGQRSGRTHSQGSRSSTNCILSRRCCSRSSVALTCRWWLQASKPYKRRCHPQGMDRSRHLQSPRRCRTSIRRSPALGWSSCGTARSLVAAKAKEEVGSARAAMAEASVAAVGDAAKAAGDAGEAAGAATLEAAGWGWAMAADSGAVAVMAAAAAQVVGILPSPKARARPRGSRRTPRVRRSGQEGWGR